MPEGIAIVADTPEGDPYVTAAELRDFVAERLARWKRVRIVPDAAAADLVMKVRYRRLLLEGPAPEYRIVVEVEAARGGKPFWSGKEERSPIPGAGAGGAHGNAWKRMLPGLLKHFREEVEKTR